MYWNFSCIERHPTISPSCLHHSLENETHFMIASFHNWCHSTIRWWFLFILRIPIQTEITSIQTNGKFIDESNVHRWSHEMNGIICNTISVENRITISIQYFIFNENIYWMYHISLHQRSRKSKRKKNSLKLIPDRKIETLADFL